MSIYQAPENAGAPAGAPITPKSKLQDRGAVPLSVDPQQSRPWCRRCRPYAKWVWRTTKREKADIPYDGIMIR